MNDPPSLSRLAPVADGNLAYSSPSTPCKVFSGWLIELTFAATYVGFTATKLIFLPLPNVRYPPIADISFILEQ
jgi:hypothetical protein